MKSYEVKVLLHGHYDIFVPDYRYDGCGPYYRTGTCEQPASVVVVAESEEQARSLAEDYTYRPDTFDVEWVETLSCEILEENVYESDCSVDDVEIEELREQDYE